MRKRYRVLVLAAIVAGFIVPVGFALSLESGAATRRGQYVAVPAGRGPSGPALVTVGQSAAPLVPQTVPDGAKLFAVGTALFGLAAAVRRVI
jgi:hypothetical protein